MRYRTIKYVIVLFLLITANSVYSKKIDPIDDVDTLIRKADFTQLVNTPSVRNIIAQTKNPNKSTDEINDFNEFIVLGVNKNNETVVAKFDINQKLLQRITYKNAWMGVADFTQNEIPNLSFQEGLRATQSCMYDKGQVVSNTVSRIVIYKNLKTQQIVYDYAFSSPDLYENFCQEILYIPAKKDCAMGIVAPCHQDIMNLQKSSQVIKSRGSYSFLASE